MTRYVLLVMVVVTFGADALSVGLLHALTWLLGVVTGLALASAFRGG